MGDSIGSTLWGGNQSKESSSQTNGPSAFNAPYIGQQFSTAQNLLNSQEGNWTYNGQLYAPINQNQINGAQQTANFGSGAGSTLANSGAAALTGLYGNAGAYSTNAGTMAANGVAAPNSAIMDALNGYATGSAPLQSALNSSGTAGANTISGLLNNFGTVANQAMSDPTQRITQNAQSYMNSAPVQNAINSTNAQIQQTLNEQTLPGLNQSAAANGNLNSSRAGMEAAMTKEGAGIAEGNADSSILNNAFNTGINTASGLYQNGLSTALGASSAGTNAGLSTASTAGSQQLGAANSSINQQLAGEGLDANTKLNANQQLGQGLFDAALGTGNVMGAGTTAGQQASALGDLQQQNQQGQDNANFLNWQTNMNTPWSVLTNYANVVDNPNYQTADSTGKTSSYKNPGVMQNLMGFGMLGMMA